jgi:hypothetical protein
MKLFVVFLVSLITLALSYNGHTKYSSNLNGIYFLSSKSLSNSLNNGIELNRKVNTEGNVMKGIKNLISFKGWNGNQIFNKKDIAKLGLNVLLSYGFVSSNDVCNNSVGYTREKI